MLHNKSSRLHSIIQRKIDSEMELPLLPELDFCGHGEIDHFEQREVNLVNLSWIRFTAVLGFVGLFHLWVQGAGSAEGWWPGFSHLKLCPRWLWALPGAPNSGWPASHILPSFDPRVPVVLVLAFTCWWRDLCGFNFLYSLAAKDFGVSNIHRELDQLGLFYFFLGIGFHSSGKSEWFVGY